MLRAAAPGPTSSSRRPVILARSTGTRCKSRQQCTNPAGVVSNGFTASNSRGGWTVGYGTEFALTRNWSAKAEYNYISFGDRNVTASDGSLLNVGMHASEVKVGVNYRFDGGAVVY